MKGRIEGVLAGVALAAATVIGAAQCASDWGVESRCERAQADWQRAANEVGIWDNGTPEYRFSLRVSAEIVIAHQDCFDPAAAAAARTILDELDR